MKPLVNKTPIQRLVQETCSYLYLLNTYKKGKRKGRGLTQHTSTTHLHLSVEIMMFYMFFLKLWFSNGPIQIFMY